MKNADYLGDGVYVQEEDGGYHVVLSTGCHIGAEGQHPENVIFLDSSVILALYRWLEAHGKARAWPAASGDVTP